MPRFRQKQSPQEALLKGVKKENASVAPGERFKRKTRETVLPGRGRPWTGRTHGEPASCTGRSAASSCCHWKPAARQMPNREGGAGIGRSFPDGASRGQARRRFLMDFPVSASVWRASESVPAIRAARSRTIFWRMRSTRSRPSWVMATMILRRSLAALMRFR